MVDALEEYVTRSGTARAVDAGTVGYPDACRGLGVWVAQTRRLGRGNALLGAVRSRLEVLPGWTWEPLSGPDRDMVEAYASFVAWEKEPVVPAGHVEGGAPLGEWMRQRSREVLSGTSRPELVEEILALAPLNAAHTPRCPWDESQARRDLAVAALAQYAAAAPLAQMPVGHVEVVDGWPVRLHEWCARARRLHGQHRLPGDLVADLEALPGWVWRKQSPAGGVVVSLPAGIEHGTPTGRTYFNCGCQPCLQASRRYQAQYKQRQIEQFMAGWESAPGSAIHVRGLLETNPQLPHWAAAAAAGVTSTLLERLLQDPATPIPPWMADMLGALTVADIMAWTRPTPRGDLATRRDEPGDAAAHAERLQRMWAAGWTRAQLACALGFSGNLGAIGRVIRGLRRQAANWRPVHVEHVCSTWIYSGGVTFRGQPRRASS